MTWENTVQSLFRNIATTTLFATAATFTSLTLAGPIGTLELNFNTSNFGSLFPAGSDSMRIHYKNGNSSSDKTVTVAAGMFSGTAVTGENTTINTDTLFQDANNVFAYCIDIMKLLQASAVYHIETVQQNQVVDNSGVRRDFGRMLTFLGAVNQVLQKDEIDDGFGFTPDSKNWLRPSEGWMSGAIQLGIWESLYEKEDANLSVTHKGGDDTQWFWADTASDTWRDVDAQGLSFLDSVFALVNDPQSGVSPVNANEVLWARTDTGQDVLIDPVDVPVPATGFLLLAGLGALAARRRRQV